MPAFAKDAHVSVLWDSSPRLSLAKALGCPCASLDFRPDLVRKVQFGRRCAEAAMLDERFQAKCYCFSVFFLCSPVTRWMYRIHVPPVHKGAATARYRTLLRYLTYLVVLPLLPYPLVSTP